MTWITDEHLGLYLSFCRNANPNRLIPMRTKVQTFMLVCLLCLGLVVGLGLLIEVLF